MTNPRRAFVLGVLFVVFTAPYRFSAGAPAPMSGAITGGHYLTSGTVDPVTVLPAPPEIGSIPGRADRKRPGRPR